MKAIPSAWILVFLIVSGCNPDERFLFQHKGIWQEISLKAYLYENEILIDSVEKSAGLGQYRFRGNGRGEYSSDSLQVDLEWSYDEPSGILILCEDEAGIRFCRNTEVLSHTDNTQSWRTEVELNATQREVVFTELEFVK